MFLCISLSKDIQIITMLEKVKELLQEVEDFVPNSAIELELSTIIGKGIFSISLIFLLIIYQLSGLTFSQFQASWHIRASLYSAFQLSNLKARDGSA